MILRPISRPQRQLQAICTALRPCRQRRAASTKTVQLPTRPIQSVQLAKRRNLPVSNCRGLATEATGFEGYELPRLAHDETFVEHGVEGFLSPTGFNVAWTQYQSMMLDNLTSMTYGTADATMRPINLAKRYSRNPDKASLFNYASMAVNNHIFFNCLSPKKTEPTARFRPDIEESFCTYDTLRTEMIETADAMFGPGFVWIVKDGELGKMKILCTYLAGSPFPEAHPRVQKIDMATSVPDAQQLYADQQPTKPVGAFGNHSTAAYEYRKRAQNGYNGEPILCVNTWEHAYLYDFGIGGKRDYLEKWWERIDWAVVENNANQMGPESGQSFNRISSRNPNRSYDKVLRPKNFLFPYR